MRNRYIDTLRAAAILRVIVYHAFGWAWLTVALPAMGVMFALAGSLMAASLTANGARRAVTSRIRRLVPALWALGAIAVPVMLVHGWRPHWYQLVFWVVPVDDPPGSVWGQPFWQVLWYLRAYLWFVLVSPLLYLCYRRAPWATLAAPLAALVILNASGFALPAWGDAIMWDLVTYGACWVAGFAHQDGQLARIALPVLVTAVVGLAVAGAGWLLTHPGPDGYDLNDVPLARALWSLAFVLAALRWRPNLGWLDRVRPLDTVVRLVNARAVTIYLWHYPMITVAGLLFTAAALGESKPWNLPLLLATVLLLTAVVVAALGWVEDVAARRRPAVWPLRRRPAPAPAEPVRVA